MHSSLVRDTVEPVVNRITESIESDPRIRRISTWPPPDREAVLAILDELRGLLFPGYFGTGFGAGMAAGGELRRQVEASLGRLGGRLLEQVAWAIRYAAAERDGVVDECDLKAAQIVSALLRRLPEIRRLLSLDVQAAFDGDPAARHTDETILCYPGIHALAVHRIAHELELAEVPIIPRMMSEAAHSATGIDIHPGARIGRSFFIDHGTGVVIGETTVIGDHCKIYQGVTLGARSLPRDERGRVRRGLKRHPTLEDHVTVYAGATILGGDTVIGSGSVINGGVFITGSVPPGHVVRAPQSDVTLRSNPETPPSSYRI